MATKQNTSLTHILWLAIGLCGLLFVSLVLPYVVYLHSNIWLVIKVLAFVGAATLVVWLTQLTHQQNTPVPVDKGTDMATGLPDNSKLLSKLELECRRCVREFVPLTVMLVGTPNPLAQNDLSALAQHLKQSVCRPGDVVARLNDTTFALLLPSTNELVQQLAERCLSTINELNLGQPVSIGVCTLQPTAELTVSFAIEKAQSQLNKALLEGGVVCFEAQEHTDPSVTYSY